MKPKIGIFGLSGCWGEQIIILNCEDQLLDIVGATEIVDFLGGSSVNDEESPLAIAFVEGSVANGREEEQLRRIRERAEMLVACGTCACFGGVAAMDAEQPREQVICQVYGADAAVSAWDIRPHRPLADFVKVDVAIPGCPMEKTDFLRATASLLNGDLPQLPAYPVCLECKMNENDCLLISRGLPCAGPITSAGCGARCPGYNVVCIGCRGPVEECNIMSLQKILEAKELKAAEIRCKLRTFAAPALDRTERGGLA
ncbi:MAG: NADH:ubiquinone oxidoreductase [Acidobacteriota bacterium]|jgi:coenzyme F420-reducing hydrogenase gamma subunit